MTTIVYSNGHLAADSQMTFGDFIYTESADKIRIFSVGINGKNKSVIVTGSGLAANVSWFEHWFVSGGFQLLPPFYGNIDLDKYESIAHVWKEFAPPNIDEAHIWVAFDGKLYEMYGLSTTFIEMDLKIPHMMGSGAEAAKAILSYNPKASPLDVVRSVSRVDMNSGGDFISHVNIKSKKPRIQQARMK